MVTRQIEWRGVKDPRVLAAMRNVPREKFVPQDEIPYAFDDCPLPIGLGQTISQPYIVAFMTELLKLKGSENVLEIGTGSGYQAAILSTLAKTVHSVEQHKALAEKARQVLEKLGYLNVSVHCGDGTLGHPSAAPYDGIMVTAGAPQVPQPLLDQLAEGGRLVIPVGGMGSQMLQVITRNGNKFKTVDALPVVFVPLRGEHGWQG